MLPDWVKNLIAVRFVSISKDGEIIKSSNGSDVGATTIIDGDGVLVAASGLTGPSTTLTTTGIGSAVPIGSGVSKLTFGVVTALTGPVLIGFGDNAADAESSVEGGSTVANLLGMVIDLPVGDGIGKTCTVKVPRAYWKTATTTPHFALAEAAGTPSGQLQQTQGSDQ